MAVKKEAITELLDYIVPIFNLSGISINTNRTLYLDNPSDVFKNEEGKFIVFPMNYHEWGELRKEENNEVFNPFVIKKHMLFLASLVSTFLEQVNMDVDIDDDGFIISNENSITPVRTINFKEPNGLIHFQFVMGKNQDDSVVLSEGIWTEEKTAIWLGCMNAIKSFYIDQTGGKSNLPSYLKYLENDTITLIPKINKLLERLVIERRRVIADDKTTTEISEMTLMDDNYEVRDIPDSYFIEIDINLLPDNFAFGVDDESEIEDQELLMALPIFKDVLMDIPGIQNKENVYPIYNNDKPITPIVDSCNFESVVYQISVNNITNTDRSFDDINLSFF